MNIKEKLIEQLSTLEEIQRIAIKNGDTHVASNVSNTILLYIERIEDYEDDYICPDCEEALAEEMLHQEIADASDMPIEIVKRVLAGQDEVLNGD